MKKEVIVLILLGILLVSPLVFAQEQVQTYSGLNRFVDSVKLAFSGGDNKVNLALEIREKEVNSAMTNVQNQKEEKAIQNLEKAKEKLQIVQEKVSLDTSEEVKINTEGIIDKIGQEENLPKEFDEYIFEEEKTLLTAVLTEKTYEYCKELSEEDFNLMLKDEECNPKTAPEPLREDLEKLKDLQERMFVKLMLEIRSCIDDPGTCNCEDNEDVEQKAKCEKMVALALKCEYKDDESACDELDSMNPEKGDGFAESFVPDFLMNLFREKESKMINYGIEPSCGVPEECWDENDKPECKQYEHLKETSADWDEYGNWIGHEIDCDEKIPTMEESIPQCFDENGIFLEEKCGEITMVENEEGLINYIIGKEVENVIDEFENKSQNTIDINGTKGRTEINEIREEIKGIKEGIAERTFAPGTSGVGEVKQDIKNIIVEEGDSSGDDGLKPEVKTDVDGSGGDNGLTPEVKTETASGGYDNEEVNSEDSEGYAPGTHDTSDSPGDTIDDTYDDEIVNSGDCGDGVDCGDGSADPGTEGGTIDAPVEPSDSSITGEVIASEREESFLGRFFKRIFRK